MLYELAALRQPFVLGEKDNMVELGRRILQGTVTPLPTAYSPVVASALAHVRTRPADGGARRCRSCASWRPA